MTVRVTVCDVCVRHTLRAFWGGHDPKDSPQDPPLATNDAVRRSSQQVCVDSK